MLYRLKRDFGLTVTLHVLLSSDVSYTSGTTTKQFNAYKIKRALVLEATQYRKFAYDLSFIAANKNFTYGGFFDVKQRIIVIERRDLPRDYVPDHKHYIVFDHSRYEIVNFDENEEKALIAYHVKELKGQRVYETT